MKSLHNSVTLTWNITRLYFRGKKKSLFYLSFIVTHSEKKKKSSFATRVNLNFHLSCYHHYLEVKSTVRLEQESPERICKKENKYQGFAW